MYAFVVDWRLALLSIATIPIYVGMYGMSMRGMNEKTAQMDTKLAQVSATMAEFVAGISVVKAFGKVGQAHKAYLDAPNEFSKFYRAWCMPLVSMAVASFSWVSIPVLLIVNLGGGALMMNAGWVSIYEVITTTLIALVLAGSVDDSRNHRLVVPARRVCGSEAGESHGATGVESARCATDTTRS
ncbi:ABC transporter transmembrane domain-containing protein [Actinotignum urinale]|uniref:ABC transporter transmembrane domain-containing protein n=1 Tax=Actinotignum urinale TaxID=190146 RepID=UPI00370D715B